MLNRKVNKGIIYELQSYNYLINNYKNYFVYLWKNVPHKYIYNLKLDNLIISTENIENDDNNCDNKAIDIGCDIMMINKNDDNDIILVQCKNYLDKNVCIKDLSGFSFLLAFSHIPLKGLIISNTNLSDRIMFKLNFIDKIKHIKLDYIDKMSIKINDNIIIPRNYQLDVVNKFKNINKGIIQLPCAMGYLLVDIKMYKNI